jgi:UDP-2-acetamido-3-amino-2,3-dideoxy-glucuronate N-acetyltransferase
MTKTSQVGIGVAGCGYWGRNLVRNFHELGALRAICDVDGERLDEIGKTYGVSGMRSFDDLMALPEIQGIAIAAPAAQHFELAKRALLAGKDVFVEKPLALRVEDGEELIETARKLRRILMVGHLLQYHPAIVELRNLIRVGDLGKVHYIYSSRLNWGKLRTEENILWSFAPHDISAILSLLGETPTSVVSHSGSYLNNNISDVTLTSLDFPSGVKAYIFVSWLHPFKEQRLVIVGDRKTAVFDDTEPHRKLVLYPHQIDWVNRVPIARKAEGQNVPLCPDEPLLLECRHFVEVVRDRTRPRTDGENGLQVLRVLQACELSIKKPSQPAAVSACRAQYFVHPTAVVDSPCEIGENTYIWHFSHVMENSKIGKHCNLGQNVHVAPGVKIGDNVKIQNNVSLYTGVELEDDVFCGPSMVFTNVINPRSHVNRKHEYQSTIVKRGASLGANSTVVCGVKIGAYAFVAAGAVVTHDVSEYALVMGVPSKQVGWMCECGERLSLPLVAEHSVTEESVRKERAVRVRMERTTCRACGIAYQLNGMTLRRLINDSSSAKSKQIGIRHKLSINYAPQRA